MVQAYAGLADHLTPAGEAPAGSLMTLLDVLGGLSAASGVLAGLLGREHDGRGRRACAARCCARLRCCRPSSVRRGTNGRPEFGSFGVPLPAVGGDLVLSRTAPPPAVTAAFGVSDLTEVPAAIAAVPVAQSLRQLAAAGVDAVRACADPGELTDDPWAATLLHRDRCALVRPPWEFTA
jgi:CoA:oxalate CoA-transferase